MRKFLCVVIIFILFAFPFPIFAAPADTVIENLSAFHEQFNVTTGDLAGAFRDAFLTKPELVFYYNGMSSTIYSDHAECKVQYANTDIAIDSVLVAKSTYDIYQYLRTAMANAETNVYIVFTDGKNQSTDFSELIDQMHERDYISYMGYKKISISKFSNNYSNAAAYQIKITYGADSAALVEMKKQTQAEVARLVTEYLKPDMSEYMLIKSIHDYLIDITRYAQNSNDPIVYYAYGPLLKGTGVCEGYSEAARLLFDAVGIESVYATGTVDDKIPHAWNIIKIGGNWYQLDITWDDPITSDGRDIKTYDYFNITDAEMAVDHIWSGNYPKCTATDKGVGATQTTVRPQSQESSVASLIPSSAQTTQNNTSSSEAVSQKPSEPSAASVSSTASPVSQQWQPNDTESSSVITAQTTSSSVVSPDLPTFSEKTSQAESQPAAFEFSAVISVMANQLGLSVPTTTILLFILLLAIALIVLYLIFKRKA